MIARTVSAVRPELRIARQTPWIATCRSPGLLGRQCAPTLIPGLPNFRTVALSSLIVLLLLFTPGLCVAQQPPEDPFPATAAEKKAEPVAPQAAAEKPAGKPKGGIPTTPIGVAEAMGWDFTGAFIAASLLAVWFAVERLVVLRRNRVIPRAFVTRFLSHLEQGKLGPEEALKLCEDNGSPIATVFAHGVRKWGKPSVEVEQAIIDGGERQVGQLRKHLRVLNGVSSVSPLIGLLGTVVGMIQSFNSIANAEAAGRSEQLAIGIALALLTTAVGLLIAIPSLVLYMYFAGKVDSLVGDMDHLSQTVVNLISAEALAAPSSVIRPRTRGRSSDPKDRETA